jgi:hypothetical protein
MSRLAIALLLLAVPCPRVSLAQDTSSLVAAAQAEEGIPTSTTVVDVEPAS